MRNLTNPLERISSGAKRLASQGRKYLSKAALGTALALPALALYGCGTNIMVNCPIPEEKEAEEELCTDTCFYAFDGECDDGGPDSLYSVCSYGTDCADCGPR